MRTQKFLTKAALAIFLGIITAAGISLSASAMEDRIIAVVNDEVITLKDLKAYIASMYGQLHIENQDPFEIDEIMRQYETKGINQLIEDKLILAAAKDREIAIKTPAIDKKFQEIKSRYPSEDVFQTMLDQQGMTVTDIRNKIADQMKAKYMVDSQVRSKIFVNPQEVTEYYDQHKDGFIRKARVNLDSIFISFDKGRDDAKAKAQEAFKLIREGADFQDILKKYSDLPSVGFIEEGQMKPEIEEQVFKMKDDEVSDPVEVDNGIYIFKFVGKSPREVQTIKDVKDQIYNQLFDEKFKKRFDEWINKLRQKAYVEIRQ